LQPRTRYWPAAEGELAESRVVQFELTDLVESDQDYLSKVLYKFNVLGVIYEDSRISSWNFVAGHNARFVLEIQMSSIQRFPDDRVKKLF
jgi:hypothetical protein